MVGNNLTEKQLQEIVDKTILYSDKDGDGKISFQEFCDVSDFRRTRVINTVEPPNNGHIGGESFVHCSGVVP